DPKALTVVAADAPLVPAGTPGAATFADSVTLTVRTERAADLLSVASMLVCTNDGFTGVDAVHLPHHLGDTVVYYGGSYDAGTEINTEYFGDLVPPCQGLIGVTGDPGTGASNPALAEGGVVSTPHAGIQGISDLLPAVHGWTDPAVRVTITRVPNIRTYEVTIRNLTGGQPLTPPLLATHDNQFDLFQVGHAASEGIMQIAENGNLAPAIAMLTNSEHVLDVVVGDVPLVPAGTPGAATFPDTVTLTIEGTDQAKFLSYASMLICTNDGFTGLNSYRLPHNVGQSRTTYRYAYDAGTEINTEYFGDIVPPCQGLIGVTGDPGTGASNPALAEGGQIHRHDGIQGITDLLPEVHGWDGAVVEITITRVD
ncbi:MAG: spondin domain-containing protein, partial [Anaerolineales bacterium]|nr:spondin domain-containing protein [Anaerolineales bacterium]